MHHLPHVSTMKGVSERAMQVRHKKNSTPHIHIVFTTIKARMPPETTGDNLFALFKKLYLTPGGESGYNMNSQ